MDSILYLATIVLQVGLIGFVLVLMQYERGRSHEREMKLIKAVMANNVEELKMAEESPKDTRTRMKIENELAIRAEKLRQADEQNQPDEEFIRVPI